MSQRIYLNDGWGFTTEYNEDLLADIYAGSLEEVRIPHTCRQVPFHYFSEKEYQMLCGYRRDLDALPEWKGRRLLLTFDGAAHDATVYVNGVQAARHRCGYTSFTADITELVSFDRTNHIVVKLDTREDLNVPPFGNVIDYLTYGGIYRDVYLDIKDPSYIRDVFLRSGFPDRIDRTVPASAILYSEFEVADPAGLTVRQEIRRRGTGEFTVLGECPAETGVAKYELAGISLWDVLSPALYEVRTALLRGGDIIDTHTVSFGFRRAEFRPDGFYLNDRKVRIRGLNRHQSYAYQGYAMPDSLQAYDADILKNELGLNAVRTSHYPQAQSFVSRCDELGLLVFTEIPGWQHIGDSEWKHQAIENVREMVLQYRNHPSIVLWGVRINESADDDELYIRTNRIARMLDPSRQTGGVRCIKKSHLLEDVYTYNDFSHTGDNAGSLERGKVTPETGKGYMVTEYNGHMFPTKSYDDEAHRLEHALRHANVINSVAGMDDVAGSFGWCMFDYNTHKEFGSGDRICHHGVLDMFRNHKLAAAVYAMQQDETPVLEISSSMDVGEHPASAIDKVYIFTNADSVKFYRNGVFIKEFTNADSSYGDLAHGPVLIDDYIGDRLETEEHMSPELAAILKPVLNRIALGGVGSMRLEEYISVSRALLGYNMKVSDLYGLYDRCVGNWGGNSNEYRFEGIKDGKVVSEVTRTTMNERRFDIRVSSSVLTEGKSYDAALVRIRLVDEYGNLLNYANDPVAMKAEGPIEIVGPFMISLNGGMGGTYVRTTGGEGEARLSLYMPGGPKTVISFTVRRGTDQ